MRQLNSERVRLDLDVQVWPLLSWTVRTEFAALAAAFQAADTPSDEYSALAALANYFMAEARPTWEFADHLGEIPQTQRGFLRLPQSIQWPMVNGWLETFDSAVEPVRPPLALHVVESDAASAVDAVYPPGALRSEVKRRLRAKKVA